MDMLRQRFPPLISVHYRILIQCHRANGEKVSELQGTQSMRSPILGYPWSMGCSEWKRNVNLLFDYSPCNERQRVFCHFFCCNGSIDLLLINSWSTKSDKIGKGQRSSPINSRIISNPLISFSPVYFPLNTR